MFRNCLLALALSTAAIAVHADTLLLDGLEMASSSISQRPTRGLSMDVVETRYGTPANKSGPVGAPPISRWEYPAYTVFFEFDHVIHSVPRR
jgi:hypothetical protein